MQHPIMVNRTESYAQQIQHKGYVSIPRSYYVSTDKINNLNKNKPLCTFCQDESSKINPKHLQSAAMHRLIAADKAIVMQTSLFRHEKNIHLHLSQTSDELYSYTANHQSAVNDPKMKLLFIHYLNQMENTASIDMELYSKQQEEDESSWLSPLKETILITYECHCMLTVFHAAYQNINNDAMLLVSFSS